MIAVAGGKGGCGKTTTTLGIASVLGERESVTVVDADVDMPDLHVVTGTPVTPGASDFANGASLASCRHSTPEFPGVSVVPTGVAEGRVTAAIERLRGVDDHVLVDTPAGASVDVTRPIRFADSVILVSTPTRESLVDTAKTAALARSLGTPIEGLVVNRSDGRVDPTDLLDCAVLAHVPTVGDGVVHRVERSSFARVVRAIGKRNT